MPINAGYFVIRQPKISYLNSVYTSSPSSTGNFLLKDALRIKYVGSASKCILYITGTKLLTICDDNNYHPDNLQKNLTGLTIRELIDFITSNTYYQSNILLGNYSDICFFDGVLRQDIKDSFYTVKYNTPKEYLAEVTTEGMLGNAEVGVKENDFSYQGQVSRWSIDQGKIYDQYNVLVSSSGITSLGNEGVFIVFKKSLDSSKNDLSNEVIFTDIELSKSTDQELSSIIFQPAPLMEDSSLVLKINQDIKARGIDYVVSYGDLPEITAYNNSPYTFNSSNNILSIGWDNDSYQYFTIPEGTYSAYELTNLLNSYAINFSFQYYTDDYKKSFLKVIGSRGTLNHQIRIGDGSANSVLGFSSYSAKKGSGTGQIFFMTPVINEILTPVNSLDTFAIDVLGKLKNNPFLGVYTKNFSILENDSNKILGEDYLVQDSGVVNLIKNISNENLIGKILHLDNALFEPSYVIYQDDVPLVEGIDYTINPQGGWINLEKSAFPGRVFSATYTNNIKGKVEKEIILGSPASMVGSLAENFNIQKDLNEFRIFIDNLPEQIFTLDISPSTSTTSICEKINSTAIGFKCVNCKGNVEIYSLTYGPKSSIRIGDGSVNKTLGFSYNQMTVGSGAKGGENSLEISNPPMDITSFSAPQGGDTIIIKNNDVSSRYKSGSVIKMGEDYYQIDQTKIESKANIISSVPGPYTVISGNNDTFEFTIDNESKTTVIFDEGISLPIETMIGKINSVRPLSAKLYNLNGSDKIQILGSSSVLIGEGNANRTLGFDDYTSDDQTGDSFIKIIGTFKNNYSAPSMYTSYDAISFEKDTSLKFETPQNSSTLKIYGDLTKLYVKNKLIRIQGYDYYKIISSYFDGVATEISLNNRLSTPIFIDTDIYVSTEYLYEEGDTELKTSNSIYLESPHEVIKNGSILIQDEDYSINESGDITLDKGLSFNDAIYINYVARRYVSSDTIVKANYSYFNFLPKGTNLTYSVNIYNPDSFYVRVIHGSDIFDKTFQEVKAMQASSQSSGSSGFPTGELPATENEQGGVDTYVYSLGDVDDKINVCKKVFTFYDDRIKSFEEEKKLINGYLVGAESGYVTLQQVIDSATLNPPQRLFPYPDSRSITEISEPLYLSALKGENKNDSGSSASGFVSNYLLDYLNSEKTVLNDEITKLNNLKILSTSSSYLQSNGNIASLTGGEQIQIYVEIKNNSNSLVQKYVTITLPGGINSGDFPPIYIPATATDVANAINSAVNSAFGLAVNLCSVNGSQVRLNASATSYCKCCLVTQDNAKINFGLGNQASLRSRHTSYTAGATYTITVPGTGSVHLDIISENNKIDYDITYHNNQLTQLATQMDDWVGSFEQSFNQAKNEKVRSNFFISEMNYFKNKNNLFIVIKNSSGIFDSIDSTAIIDSRVSDINTRISSIDRRIAELNTRLSSISTSISQEYLYDKRYGWINLIANKNYGYYAVRNRLVVQEELRLKNASNSTAIINSKSDIVG